LLNYGRWFSPGTPASSITKTGRLDIAETLLNVALSTKILTQIYTTIRQSKLRVRLKELVQLFFMKYKDHVVG
jgi:hypothetical protein